MTDSREGPERSLVERLSAILRHGVSYDDADTIKEAVDRLAEAEAERDEARRRRDEWRKKAEGYDDVRRALREKVGAPWPPHMSRLLWAGVAADEKKRADDAEAEIERLRGINEELVRDFNTMNADGARLSDANRLLRDALNTIDDGGKDAMIWVDGELREARSFAMQKLREANTERYRPLIDRAALTDTASDTKAEVLSTEYAWGDDEDFNPATSADDVIYIGSRKYVAADEGQACDAGDGYVLVPREPTEAMMQAGLYQSSHDTEWQDAYSMWVDMVDAAPATPSATPTVEAAPEVGPSLSDDERARLREWARRGDIANAARLLLDAGTLGGQDPAEHMDLEHARAILKSVAGDR